MFLRNSHTNQSVQSVAPWTANSFIHQFIFSPVECSQDTQITDVTHSSLVKYATLLPVDLSMFVIGQMLQTPPHLSVCARL